MALLITIYCCDQCQKIVPLRTDTDWENFEKCWWEGFKYQFCPDCAVKTETIKRRIADSKMLAALTSETEEQSNAGFIN